MIQLLVTTPNGNTVTIDIDQSKTIEHLKELLYLKIGIPAPFQILIFNGKIILDEKYLTFYNIMEGSILHMSLRMSASIPPIRPVDSILGKRKSYE